MSADDLQQNGGSTITLPMPIRSSLKGKDDASSRDVGTSPQSALPESSPRSATSSFRRLSLLGTATTRKAPPPSDGGDPDQVFASSPRLSSSLLQKLSLPSLRLTKGDSRDTITSPNQSPPSSPGVNGAFVAVGDLEHVLNDDSNEELGANVFGPACRLEQALYSDAEFRHDLVDLLFGEHQAETTKKLRFIAAVHEYQKSTLRKERAMKGRKIIEIFLIKSSPFQVLNDIPGEVMEANPYLGGSSPSSLPSSLSVRTIDKILFGVKREFLKQVVEVADEIRKKSTSAASLLNPIFNGPDHSSQLSEDKLYRKSASPIEDDGSGGVAYDDVDDTDDVFGESSQFVM